MASGDPIYPFTEDDLRGNPPIWLLAVTWSGLVLRWASREIEIADDDGDLVHHDGGLEVEFEQSLDLFSDLAADPIVSINGLIPPGDVNVALRIAQGHHFEDARCELAQWIEGRTWNKRVVRMIGNVALGEYDTEGEPLSFDLEPDGLVDTNLVPGPDQIVNYQSWLQPADREVGKYYPLIYGQPGLDLTNAEIEGGSPALMVDDTGTEILLLCGERTYLADGTADVLITNMTSLDSESFNVTTMADQLGRTVTIADISGAGVLTINSGDEYWARWDTEGDAQAVGGVPNVTNTEAASGAGDVIMDLLRRSSVVVDTDRFESLLDKMNRYRLAFYIDDPVSPLEWVRTQIMPLLPCSLVNGPNGVYPVWWNRSASAETAVADLVEGENVRRAAGRGVRYTGNEIRNEIRIGYAPRSDNGQPYYWRTVTGRDVGGDSDEVWPNENCRISRARLKTSTNSGERSYEYVTPIVYDAATAAAWLGWQALAYALPWRDIEYDSAGGVMGFLRVGDDVTITDTAWSLSSRVTLVQSERWSNSDLTLTLLLIDSPVRDVIPT